MPSKMNVIKFLATWAVLAWVAGQFLHHEAFSYSNRPEGWMTCLRVIALVVYFLPWALYTLFWGLSEGEPFLMRLFLVVVVSVGLAWKLRYQIVALIGISALEKASRGRRVRGIDDPPEPPSDDPYQGSIAQQMGLPRETDEEPQDDTLWTREDERKLRREGVRTELDPATKYEIRKQLRAEGRWGSEP